MITENYVSFETAKLLKEKGFDEHCFCINYPLPEGGHHNIILPNLLNNSIIPFTDEYKFCRYKEDFITIPTLQMAMKWLREDKKILISIFCHIDKGYWFCIQHLINSPYKFATSESIHRKEEILGKIQYYDTYEQACEAAIKYCLEYLI